MNTWGDMPPRKRKPAPWYNDEIPRDKAAVVAKLNKMKNDGWRALESMSLEELDALQAEAEGAIYYVDDFGFTGLHTAHDRAIMEAREAIKDQRYKIRQREADAHLEQIHRFNAVVEAASHIRAAVDCIEAAQRIKRDPSFYLNVVPAELPAIDVTTMTDGELKAAERGYSDELSNAREPDHRLFAMMNTPGAVAIAAELKEQNEARAARIDMAMANSKAAREELERREVDTVKAAARNEILQANLDEVLTELQGRIEELEASK